MTYLTYNSHEARFVQITMSADQTGVADTSTTVQFDTITADSGHGVSISSNLITLEANRHYWGFGVVVMTRTSNLDSQRVKFFESDGTTELNPADGFFKSELPADDNTDSRVFQFSVSPTSTLSFYVKTQDADGDIESDGSHIMIIEMS